MVEERYEGNQEILLLYIIYSSTIIGITCCSYRTIQYQ